MKHASQSHRRRASAALLGLLLGILSLLPASGAARADGAAPSLQVLEVGWDGNVTQSGWAPVRVKVTGGAADRDVVVEVTLENQYQPGPNQTVRYPLGAFAQEVSLPAGQAKEVTVWVPAGYQVFGTVRLKSGEEELASEPVEFRATKAPFWPLVGVLASVEELRPMVGRIELPLQGLPQTIHTARLKAEALPNLPDRLKGLRAMVVQGNAPANLSDEQKQAIRGWVENGGHLLLAGGPESALSANVLPEGSLPLAFGGAVKDVDLSALVAWSGAAASAGMKGPAVRMQPAGGAVLAGPQESPLAWRTSLGKGSVTVLAVDPTLEPLSSWEGTTALLKKALSPALADATMSGMEKFGMVNSEQEMTYRLRGTVDALPMEAYPGWKQVALYLGGFALLAGPVLHLLFWQNRRRGWIWLAVPAGAVLVAGAIYVVGVSAGGRDLLGHTVSYVQISPQTQTANQLMMVGLYSPMNPELKVTVPADLAISAMGLVDSPGFGPWGVPQADETRQQKPPFRLVNGRETRIEFYANQWSMRPLALSRTLGKEVGQVTARLTLEGSQIKGTVTNDTPYDLEDACVVVGATVVKLGDMAPGQTAEVALEPQPINPMQYYSLATLFYGEKVTDPAVLQRRGPVPPGVPEPMELPADPEIRRRSQMVESMLYQPMPGPQNFNLPLLFTAFTADLVGPAVVDLKGHPDHHLNLIRQDLRLELPAGPFTIPSALIPYQMGINAMRGWGSGGNGTITWFEMDNATVAFTFQPPLAGEAELTALEITTQQVGASQPSNNGAPTPVGPPELQTARPAEAGIFQVYNWTTAAWEPLPGGQERVRITNVQPYLGPDSQVKVQVVTGDRMVRFIQPQVTIEGRGAAR